MKALETLMKKQHPHLAASLSLPRKWQTKKLQLACEDACENCHLPKNGKAHVQTYPKYKYK